MSRGWQVHPLRHLGKVSTLRHKTKWTVIEDRASGERAKHRFDDRRDAEALIEQIEPYVVQVFLVEPENAV
jgi:hypothetical protein